MSKLNVSIGSKDFDITLDEDFARFFEKDFRESIGAKKNIETKDLLWAFVQKSYNEYLNKIEYKNLIEKIGEV
jgi:hypothetical protein